MMIMMTVEYKETLEPVSLSLSLSSNPSHIFIGTFSHPSFSLFLYVYPFTFPFIRNRM